MRDEPSPAKSTALRTYTAHDVSRILGMSPRWVLYQAERGTLPAIRVGRRVLFNREQIDALIPPPKPAEDNAIVRSRTAEA